jgi:aspartyl-tRNA(Asn)/glutamyl-tRNA(Gln) amidotransferase subunit A
MTDAHWLTIAEAAALIKRRDLSPVDLTQACLDRIAALEPRLNAFITVLGDDSLAQARTAEDEIANGQHKGPLHGIPVALKDIFDVAGVPTTAASPVMRGNVAAADSGVTERFREAGSVIIGKLNLHEIALGATGINPHTGPARNPWDTDRITGGSSSGSGASVASGECPAAMGTDTGGSIRIPASLCGVVGLKPTFGRVSRRGVFPLSWSLDHTGPLTRTVEDAALVLEAIAGYDPGDPASGRADVPDYTATLRDGVKGLRIGVPDRFFLEHLGPGIEDAFRAALKVLEGLGATVRQVPAPHIEEMPGAVGSIMLPEAYAIHQKWLQERPQDYGEDVRYRLEYGATYPAAQYINSLRFREMVVEEWREQVFSQVDIVATPTTASTAGPVDKSDLSMTMSLIRLTNPINLLGAPAISVPCGFTSEGMPYGLQLVGRWFDEATVLRAAHAYEQAADWHASRPPL